MTELEEEEERSIEKRLAERVAVKLPLVLSPLPFLLSPLPVRTGEGVRGTERGDRFATTRINAFHRGRRRRLSRSSALREEREGPKIHKLQNNGVTASAGERWWHHWQRLVCKLQIT